MQANYNIIYYPIAYTDISEILDYITNTFNAQQTANKLLEKFKNSIANLASFPFSGTELELVNEDLQSKYRWIKVDNYTVFYTVNKDTYTVSIMRILYGASDFLSKL